MLTTRPRRSAATRRYRDAPVTFAMAICPRVQTTREPRNEFLWNFIFENFVQICRHVTILLNRAAVTGDLHCPLGFLHLEVAMKQSGESPDIQASPTTTWGSPWWHYAASQAQDTPLLERLLIPDKTDVTGAIALTLKVMVWRSKQFPLTTFHTWWTSIQELKIWRQ
jgi:hypothetical protein